MDAEANVERCKSTNKVESFADQNENHGLWIWNKRNDGCGLLKQHKDVLPSCSPKQILADRKMAMEDGEVGE
jgi:hypothetical protein